MVRGLDMSRETYVRNLGKQQPRIREIIRLDAAGTTDREICARTHVSPSTLKRLRLTPFYHEAMGNVQQELDDRAINDISGDDVRKILAGAALDAAKLNVELMQSPDVRVAQASVWDILDRAGYPKTQRAETKMESKVVLDEDSARALGEALRECTVRKVPEG